MAMCFSFFFKRKETTIGTLTTLLTLLVLVPLMIVSLLSLGTRPDLSETFHVTFTCLIPFYGFVGSLNKIFLVSLNQEILSLY